MCVTVHACMAVANLINSNPPVSGIMTSLVATLGHYWTGDDRW